MTNIAPPTAPRAGGPSLVRSLTRSVAEFAATLRFEAIPERVTERIKLHIMDTLACAVAGRDVDVALAARDFAARYEGMGECPVFGTSRRLGPMAAAFANSVICNALDYDDGFEHAGKGMGHPGASIVPAALAALPGRHVDGRDFITAVAAAYEVNNRLVLSMQPTPARFAEVHGIGQHQAVGAAVACGRLMNMDTADLANCIGLAGSLTPLPSLHKYNWITRPIVSLKDFVAPAAQAGVQAVLLGLSGFTGSSDVLDGPTGYWRMVGSDRFAPSVLEDGLGERWLAESGSFKFYPACRWLAPALEAFELALAEFGRSADDIDSIEIRTFGAVAEKLMAREPTNAVDAQFSLPFLIGVLASGLPKGAAWFTRAALVDGRVRSVAARVRVTVDPDMDRLMRGERRCPSAAVAICGYAGKSDTQRIDAPLGGDLRPVDGELVLAKAGANFRSATADADAILHRLHTLENEPDVANLVASLNA